MPIATATLLDGSAIGPSIVPPDQHELAVEPGCQDWLRWPDNGAVLLEMPRGSFHSVVIQGVRAAVGVSTRTSIEFSGVSLSFVRALSGQR